MTTQRDPASWPADFGQGRYDARPGLHLVDSGDHGAAHVCTEIDGDANRKDVRGPMTRGELLALACVMLVAWLALVAAVSVAWTRWLP